MEYQPWDFDLVEVGHRVPATDGDALVHALQAAFTPVGCDALQVNRRSSRNGALPKPCRPIARTRSCSCCCKASIGIAIHHHAAGISNALVHQPFGTIILVVLHDGTPLLVAPFPQGFAEAIGPAILRLQNRKTAGCEHLWPKAAVEVHAVA